MTGTAETRALTNFLKGRVPFFRPLTDSDVAFMVEHGERRLLTPGQVLFQAGEEADALFVVVKGRLELAEGLIDQQIGEGEIVGELGLFVETKGYRRKMTVRAATLVEVFRVPFVHMYFRHRLLPGYVDRVQKYLDDLLEQVRGDITVRPISADN